jgi:hypothetical protein
MKIINLPKTNAPKPLKSRALLSLHCRCAGVADLPGLDVSDLDGKNKQELDKRNSLLAKNICFSKLNYGPLPAEDDEDDFFMVYDKLISENFALYFTSEEELRSKCEDNIERYISILESSEFGSWYEERLTCGLAARIEAGMIRNDFMSDLREKRAA